MAAVRKAQLALEKLEKSAGLTPEGKDWLITAVDPFHDTDIRPAGYPDLIEAGSVVQLVKLQMTVVAPVGLAAGTTWDCNIFNMPTLDLKPYGVYSTANSADLLVTTSQLANLGGLVALSTPTTSAAPLNCSTLDSTNVSWNVLNISDGFFLGPTRVIAQGFEVTNTTAEIYRQGAVTVWRQPQPTRATRHTTRLISGTTSNPTVQNYVTTEYRAYGPSSVAAAQLLPGSRTWDAKEGCYVVFTQNDIQLRDPILEPVMPFMFDTSQQFPSAATAAIATSSAGGPAGGQLFFAPNAVLHDYNTSGAWFTGLSQQTSLTVTWNCYIERFPTAAQQDLVVLAQPSPKYDPIALELYSRMLSDMPVGVPVRENGLGRWFMEAVSNVAPYVSGALSAIPHPVAQGAAMAAGMAGKVAGKFLAPPSAQGDPLKGERKAARKLAKMKAKEKTAKLLRG